MSKFKKCSQCGNTSFKLSFNQHAVVTCEYCGQAYNILSVKRLPDIELDINNVVRLPDNTKLKETSCVLLPVPSPR